MLNKTRRLLDQAMRRPTNRSVASALVCCVLTSVLVLQSISATSSNASNRDTKPAHAGTTVNSKPLAPPDETIIVYGPHRFDRTGVLSKASDQFNLPADAFAPFTMMVQNGDPGGSGRVLIGTVRLKGSVVFSSTELNLEVPSLTQQVSLASQNTLEVTFFSRRSSFLTITVTATRRTNPAAPSISDFSPKSGPVGTPVALTGTNLAGSTGNPTITFTGLNSTRVSAGVTSATATQVLTTVPNGAATGPIELTTTGGTARTNGSFTVIGQQDFQVIVSPAAASAIQRSTATQVVSVTSAQSTFTQLASLSATGLPAGVNATFDPAQITAGANSTLSLNLSNVDLAPGSYSFTVKGSASVEGNTLVRSASATLIVLAAGQTTLSGRVLSTDKDPIVGATVSLDGKTATTDAAGSFLLAGVTAGPARPLMVDGRTASAPNRTYPVIAEPANVVAGQANVIPYNFYLPPIDVQYEVDVVPNQNTVATNPRVAGLLMTVPAGANLRNRDGSPVTRVSITPLPIDRTPTPLPSDVVSAMVYTSQPGGAVTDRAIPVIYPNLTGADPGTRMPLFAFNHDSVQWYIYGYGRVSSNGKIIVPEIDPTTGQSYGLRDFSWHYPGPPAVGPEPRPPSCPSSRTDNPVDLATGMKIEKGTDISFGGARGRLELSHIYTSFMAQACDNCSFGRGAHHNYEYRLIGSFGVNGAGRFANPEQLDSDGVLFSFARTDPDGSLVFTTNLDVAMLGDTIRKLTSGTFEYRYADGNVMRFNANGKLIAQVDPNGNTNTLDYDGNGLLMRVTDAVGRAITLTNAGTHITSATDPLGHTWRYTYEGNPSEGTGPILTTVTDPLGRVTRYDYIRGGRLVKVTNPLGNVSKQIDYEVNSPRVVKEIYADGGFETFSYGFSGQVITLAIVTDSLGRKTTRQFNAAGYVISETDALGQESKIERDLTTNLPTSISGPCGCKESTRQYDDRGNVIAATDR